jgi:hypothetical protein
MTMACNIEMIFHKIKVDKISSNSSKEENHSSNAANNSNNYHHHLSSFRPSGPIIIRSSLQDCWNLLALEFCWSNGWQAHCFSTISKHS